jgi:hypothetical protein
VETLIFRARRSLASALEQPIKRRRKVVHSLDAGALLASLKAAIVGNAAASVATAVAVAASATALTVAVVPARHDFPPRVAAPVKVEKTEQTASRAKLADRSFAAAPSTVSAPPASTRSPQPKKWAGTHPHANGKDKPKHANNGHHHEAKPPQASNGHHPSAPTQASSSNAPSVPPGQVKSGSNGRSAAAPAHGEGGNKG